jgi:hypothetical protein
MWQDNNQVIQILADCYPKAFIVDAYRRLTRTSSPTKSSFWPGNPVNISRAVDWYCGHIGYLRQLLEGATRYDLNGDPAGTVTRDEEAGAKHRITEIHRQRQERAAEQQRNPVEVLGNMHGVPHDQFRKIPAPPLAPPPPPTVMIPPPAPEQPVALIPAPSAAPEDMCGKQLELAIKRIELATANVNGDREVAVAILRSAAEAIESAIERLHD